ncbi:unnamed protein product [Owenia fusiformis]|uniref:Uncharacterized protein n=1 Tax=Owenia fusiformis TaxID=6347 RepID=A0A8S4NRD0_OWEFU|nr:unnamed protein product [Owenia fusiformis]
MATLSRHRQHARSSSAGDLQKKNDIFDFGNRHIPIANIKEKVAKSNRRRFHTVAEFNHVRGNGNNYNHYRVDRMEDDELPPINIYSIDAPNRNSRPKTAADIGEKNKQGHYPDTIRKKVDHNGPHREGVYKLDGAEQAVPKERFDKDGVVYIDGRTLDETIEQGNRHITFERYSPRLAVKRSNSPRKISPTMDPSKFVPRPGDLFNAILEQDDNPTGDKTQRSTNPYRTIDPTLLQKDLPSPRKLETYVVTKKNSIMLPDGPALLTTENIEMHDHYTSPRKPNDPLILKGALDNDLDENIKKPSDERIVQWVSERQLSGGQCLPPTLEHTVVMPDMPK